MMLELLASLKPEVWSAIFAGISTLLLIIGMTVALVNLRIIAKEQRLQSVREFFKDLSNTSEDRRFVIQNFTFSPKCELSSEDEKKVQNVINSLNRISLLLENRLLPSRLVFSICHTQIIRCGHKLKPYLRYHEKRIGGRYGRRVRRLIEKAKRYHDVNPQHRITKIRIDPGSGKKTTIIYQTKLEKGLRGLEQRLEWRLRRVTSIY